MVLTRLAAWIYGPYGVGWLCVWFSFEIKVRLRHSLTYKSIYATHHLGENPIISLFLAHKLYHSFYLAPKNRPFHSLSFNRKTTFWFFQGRKKCFPQKLYRCEDTTGQRKNNVHKIHSFQSAKRGEKKIYQPKQTRQFLNSYLHLCEVGIWPLGLGPKLRPAPSETTIDLFYTELVGPRG